MIECDGFGRKQDREMMATAIAPAALSLSNGTQREYIVQQQIPFGAVIPHTQLKTRAAEDFLPRGAQPIQVSIIYKNIFPIAHAQYPYEGGAGVEGRAETGFAFGEGGLCTLTLDAQRERIGYGPENLENILRQVVAGE